MTTPLGSLDTPAANDWCFKRIWLGFDKAAALQPFSRFIGFDSQSGYGKWPTWHATPFAEPGKILHARP